MIDRFWGVGLMVAAVTAAYNAWAWWLVPPSALVFACGVWLAWLEPKKRATQIRERGRRHER